MEENKNKLLIVEDDKFLLDMYVIKFNHSDFQVEGANSGKEALQKIKEGYAPDIILLDVVMPNIDGFEMLKIIKKEKLVSGAILVILSNLGEKEDIEKGKKLGADDYIIKAHFTPTEVMNKVKMLVKEKK